MKKTITINISGIIFHIEEDGYEMLRRYLDDIGRYFAKFEGHSEIMEDIEARIAEILTEKLKPGKQAITIAEVTEVRAKMGEPSDFAEMESDEDEPKYSDHQYKNSDYTEGTYEPKARRLVRNGNRKMLAGVCSGIAHYFNIDAFWIRLLFVCFFFGFLFFPSITGTVLILYIVLWIAMPESFELREDEKVKKLFRDGSDDKVIGGVCSGIAAYFGVDVVAIRVLFVLLVLVFFTGVIAYIVLWAIMPEAITMADRMKMKGEPVTLSNIERSIKHSFKINDKTESDLMRVLMFPFRVLATVFNALGPILIVLAKVLLAIFGALFILISLCLLVLTFSMLGVALGIIPPDLVMHGVGNVPVSFWTNTFPLWLIIFVFITTLITALYLMLGGLKMIFHRLKVHPTLHIIGGGLWLASLVGSIVCIALLVNEFRQEYKFPEQQVLPVSAEVIHLNSKGLPGFEDDGLTTTTLTLEQAEGRDILLKQTYSARARNADKAQAAVQHITYDLSTSDSSVTLPAQFGFTEDAFFSMQDLHLTMYIPEGQRFKMSKSVGDIIRNTLTPAGYKVRDLGSNEWVFRNGNLTCISCPTLNSRKDDTYTSAENIGLKPISKVTVNDNIMLRVVASTDTYMEVMSRDGNSKIDYHQENGNLRLGLIDDSIYEGGEKLKVILHTPNLAELELNDNCFAEIQQMRIGNLRLQLSNTSRVQLDSDVLNLQINSIDNAKVRCYSKVKVLKADMAGNSEMDMLRADVEEADVTTTDNAVVRLNVKKRARLRASGNSLITYDDTNADISAETTDSGKVRLE